MGTRQVVIFAKCLSSAVLSRLCDTYVKIICMDLCRKFKVPPLRKFCRSGNTVYSGGSSLPRIINSTTILMSPVSSLSVTVKFDSFLRGQRVLRTGTAGEIAMFGPGAVAVGFLSLFG